jgi:uncharacterized phiE125 gp8 family phage protein
MAGYTLLTPPDGEPVTLDVAKAHIRVDHDDDDLLIGTLISAARAQFERETNRRLLTQQWRLSLDRYPLGPIRTDFGPVQTIDALKFTDTDLSVVTVDPAQYLTDITTEVGRVAPVLFQPWPWIYWATVIHPSSRLLPGAVQLEFTAGYGAVDAAGAFTAFDGLDQGAFTLARQAILLILGHWYSNRETVLGGEGRFMALEMPMAAQAIIDTQKIPVLG